MNITLLLNHIWVPADLNHTVSTEDEDEIIISQEQPRATQN
jgi:hypothetical protein